MSLFPRLGFVLVGASLLPLSCGADERLAPDGAAGSLDARGGSGGVIQDSGNGGFSGGSGGDTTDAGTGGTGGASATGGTAGSGGQGGDGGGAGSSGAASGGTAGAAASAGSVGSAGMGGLSGAAGMGGNSGGVGGTFNFGPPITADDNVWTWVDVPDSRCMNDTPTGFGVNLNSASDKVLIFMTGGNACFNQLSCAITANRDGYDATKFAGETQLAAPAFDRADTKNIFADWNHVYIPYCSGDAFLGDEPSGMAGGQAWNFHGFRNVTLFIERIVPTFVNMSQVLLTGASAGALGSAYNYDQFARAFGPSTKITLMEDSGPPMAAQFFATCLQQHVRQTWGISRTLPEDCPECANPSDDAWVEPITRWLLAKYPDRNFGLVSSDGDQLMRFFWGFGLNDCAELLTGNAPPQYSAAQFKAGLEDLRDRIAAPTGNAKLYMPASDQHVWVGAPLHETTHFGVVLQDWVEQALSDDPLWDNVPAP